MLTIDDARGASTQLTLVDLAGSERTRKSGAAGKTEQMKEACAINSSLATLGRCVPAGVAPKGGDSLARLTSWASFESHGIQHESRG